MQTRASLKLQEKSARHNRNALYGLLFIMMVAACIVLMVVFRCEIFGCDSDDQAERTIPRANMTPSRDVAAPLPTPIVQASSSSATEDPLTDAFQM